MNGQIIPSQPSQLRYPRTSTSNELNTFWERKVEHYLNKLQVQHNPNPFSRNRELNNLLQNIHTNKLPKPFSNLLKPENAHAKNVLQNHQTMILLQF